MPSIKQAAFLLLWHKEALYGGAAGGGKSSALLMGALQYMDSPGYAALILRRTFADLALPGAIMDRAQLWLSQTDASWNQQTKTWTFPSGATITFGYLEHENDKYRYQGAEFQYIAFDELTQFSETQYTYLFSRLRRKTGVDVPLRMRSATNPGGAGMSWVKQRFLIEGHQHGRVFIPAKLDDNPGVDREAYLESLAELDYITRKRLQDGDWTISESGGLFRREWFPIIESAPSDIVQRYRYWDLAATEPSSANPDPDYTVGLLLGKLSTGKYCVLDVRRVRKSPGEVEKLIKHTAEVDGKGVYIRIEQEPGSAGVNLIDYYRTRVLDGYHMTGVKPTGDKVTRAKLVSPRAEAKDIALVRGTWLNDFLDEVDAFTGDGRMHDDQVDALSGAYEALSNSDEIRVVSNNDFNDYRGG